jgi:hypothetical protein
MHRRGSPPYFASVMSFLKTGFIWEIPFYVVMRQNVRVAFSLSRPGMKENIWHS